MELGKHYFQIHRDLLRSGKQELLYQVGGVKMFQVFTVFMNIHSPYIL